MKNLTVHPNIPRTGVAVYSWALPAGIVVLMVTGAIGSLLAGWVAPDVIGADGLARIAWPAP